MIDPHTQFLDALEHSALRPGPLFQSSPFPDFLSDRSWTTLVRGRRVRVMDLLIQDGLTLLNILPDATNRFLELGERFELKNRHSFAEQIAKDSAFWKGLPQWWRSIGIYQVRLLGISRKRTAPVFEGPVNLSQGVHLFETQAFAPELSSRIPTSFLGERQVATVVAELENALQSLPQNSVWFLSIPALDGEGMIAELDEKTAVALQKLPLPLETLVPLLDPETFSSLREAQALEGLGCSLEEK